MRIVGRGFLAQSLAPLADRHPHAVVLAAGVSSGGGGSPEDYAREADLLYAVLRGCRPGARLVFFSSATAGMYGGPGSTGREDGPIYPTTSYARHKVGLEHVVAASGGDFLILRLAHTVGAHQRAHQLLPSLVQQVRCGRVTVFRGARRDLIDINDVVTIIDQLLTLGAARETVNIASGFAVPVDAIVAHVEARLGAHAHKDYLDRPDDTRVSVAKLLRLVPAAAGMGFGEHYYRHAIDRHICAVAAAQVAPGELTRVFPGLAASAP